MSRQPAKNTSWPYQMQPGSQQYLAKLMSSAQRKWTRIGYGGPKGGGKSFGARGIAFTLTYQMPLKIIIVRSRLNTLKKNHIFPAKVELKAFLDAGMIKYNDDDKMFEWSHNGGKVIFMYAEREADTINFDGLEADVYIFEEAGHFTKDMMQGIWKNNRASTEAIQGGSNYMPRVLFTFNWGGKGHATLRRWFWDRDFDENEDGSKYQFIFAPLDQNKKLLEADPVYEENLKELPPELRDAYLRGDPDALLGTMFTIVRDAHEVDPKTLLDPYGGVVPEHWTIAGGLDQATGSYSSFGAYAITPEGKKYKMYNYYRKKRNPKQLVSDITWLFEHEDSPIYRWTQGRRPKWIVADRYSFQKKDKYSMAATDVTTHQLFRKKGYQLIQRNYERVQAITALQTTLHFEYEKDTTGIVGLDLEPDLQFFAGMCEPTISELNAVERDPNNPEDNAHGPEVDDHAIDETKNFIMTAAKPPQPDEFEHDGPSMPDDYNRSERQHYQNDGASLEDEFGASSLEESFG